MRACELASVLNHRLRHSESLTHEIIRALRLAQIRPAARTSMVFEEVAHAAPGADSTIAASAPVRPVGAAKDKVGFQFAFCAAEKLHLLSPKAAIRQCLGNRLIVAISDIATAPNGRC